MFNRLPSFNKALSLLVLVIIFLVLISSGLFLAVAIASAAVVPITWLWGLMTGQSYDRVCDNSEIVYRLNQLGKWTIFIGIAFTFIGLIFYSIL
jgi:hypothetical protein